jgi:hypothetical protein
MSRVRAMTDRELGEALTLLGEEIDWPSDPVLASAVGDEIRDRRRTPSHVAPRLSLPSRRRTVLILVAALLTIAAVALAARLVIRLGAITVQVVPGTPTALPTNVLTPGDLGRQVSLARAEALAGFDAVLPAELGPPDRVWVDEAAIEDAPQDEVAGRIVAAWDPSPGLPEIPGTGAGALTMQFAGDWESAAKSLYSETNRFGEVIVGGRSAFWTTGPHELRLVTGDDARRVLVTGHVVIWQDGVFTIRLETALPRARMLAIAESVPATTEPG